MKILSVLLVGLAALASPFAVAGRVHHKHHSAAGAAIIDSSNIAQAFADMAGHSEWQSFKALHRKSGYESAEQEQYRYAIFQSNMARAAELHKLNPEANFGMNKFSDLHPVEFKNQYLNFKPITGLAQRANLSVTHSKTVGTVPADFDWRSPDGNRPVGVTAVKDQGQCGSCWAFSATEEVESAWILAGNKPVALAPEQTVDCDTVDGGCNGGDTTTAYRYMQTNGVQSESSYPYTAGDSGSAGTCAYNRNAVVAKISGFTYATPGCTDACDKQDEAKLKTNLYNVAPASICVDASTWQTYTSGILTAASGCQSAYSALDHCVQLVGFGVDSGTEYWSVRNSWASDWGEQGYIRLSYGANTCGVADEATFVTI